MAAGRAGGAAGRAHRRAGQRHRGGGVRRCRQAGGRADSAASGAPPGHAGAGRPGDPAGGRPAGRGPARPGRNPAGGGAGMSWLWYAVRGYLPRLIAAGLLAAAAELAALGLLATATWLLVSAAGQPPLAALTVAIVSVRALAIGRGPLRYAERLTGHDAVLRILAVVRQRLFAALAAASSARMTGPAAAGLAGEGLARSARSTGRASGGDLLSRMVSD